MKLSFSNIAWDKAHDEAVYTHLQALGYCGLELAPTRLFSENPYAHCKQAAQFSQRLYEKWGLRVCSMQSIWYGRREQIFGTAAERQALLDYTARAMEFAHAMGCGNLVFGCPKNRVLPDPSRLPLGEDFFRRCGALAHEAGAVFALEANSVCYGTNFLNTTRQVLDYCALLDTPGLGVNLDLGTCLFNGETLALSGRDWARVSHIHVSRPQLAPIAPDSLDKQLCGIPFSGYCSAEMNPPGTLEPVLSAADYLKEVLS